MNLKNVLKTYSLLRSLSDDESALLKTLRSLSDSEREQLVQTMAPVKAATKKPRKKREAKSAHQQSLSSAIQRVPKGRVKDSDNQQPCTAYIDDNGGLDLCGKFADDNIHHLNTHPDYHEFVASEQTQAASGD